MPKHVEFITIVVISAIVIIGAVYGSKIRPKVTPQAEVLTVQGDCTIYKMYDKGHRIYFSKCLDGEEMPLSE